MALIYKWLSWWAVLSFLFPLFIAYYAYKLYMDTRAQHLSTIQALVAAVVAQGEKTRGVIKNNSARPRQIINLR